MPERGIFPPPMRDSQSRMGGGKIQNKSANRGRRARTPPASELIAGAAFVTVDCVPPSIK
jgi:hypothetical protein